MLAAYLRRLAPEELPLATVFLTGRPFPLCSESMIQVGAAAVQEAARAVTGATAEEYAAAYLRRGDSGEAVAELLTSRPAPPRSITLLQARELFEALTKLPTPAARREALAQALAASRPPAAKYLVKIIESAMRIGVQESLVEEALAEAFGRDLASIRRANMLLGDLGRTAVLAREDRLREARLTLFRPLKLMLAEAIDSPEEALQIGPEWLAEDKYDGIRAQAHADGRQVRLYSRTLDEITGGFPDVGSAFVELGTELLCDGEILAQRGDRQLGFDQLSRRVGRREPDEAILREIPAVFVAFDLLAVGGLPLLEEPLCERRRRLEEVAAGSRVLPARQERVTELEAARTLFEAARERGNEGLVLKDPGSPYQPGKRGRAWLKLKRPLATLDAVIVAAEYGHGKRRGLLSDYTFAVRAGEGLAPVGKAYSGVTDAEIAFLTEHFRKSAIRDFGGGVVVPPEIVVEVAFSGVQRSGRHGSGYALRFPRLKRLRLDKPVAEIDTLERVAELWAKQKGSGAGDAGDPA